MRTIKRIFIHCTAGPATQSTAEILAFWKRQGWGNTPGYHIIIDVDGTATRLQRDERITNGVLGFNATSLHVCYKGGQNGIDTRTAAQKDTLARRVLHWKKLYPKAVVMGHRDISPDTDQDGIVEPHEWLKQCPSFDVRKWWAEVAKRNNVPI